MFFWVFGIAFVIVALLILLCVGFANHMSSGPKYPPRYWMVAAISASVAFALALLVQGFVALF